MQFEWNGVRFEAPLTLSEAFGGDRDALVEHVKATFPGASQAISASLALA